jgi:glycosyltransferase involved in cell wall biosynthesis
LILYVWNPSFAEALTVDQFDLKIYHLDDEYSFSTSETPISEREMKLLQGVDRVFIHSPALLEKKGHINPNTSFLPNGVDYQLFSTSVPEPEDLVGIRHPRIGYTGYLKKQLDWALLLGLATRHPDWSFIFVGERLKHAEMKEILDRLSQQPNVHFLGPKPTSVLSGYPQHFDVCIMPYTKDGYTKYIYPLKLHEYLAGGRPVVGTRLSALEQFADLLGLPETEEEWSRAIAEAMQPPANSESRRLVRQAAARRHDWDTLVRRLAQSIIEQLSSLTAEERTTALARIEDPIRLMQADSNPR